MAFDGVFQAATGGNAFVVHNAGAAIEQGSPYFQRRRIETEWRSMQYAGLAAEIDIGHIAHQSNNRLMGNLDTLGRTGRAGRIHHIGERAAIDRTWLIHRRLTLQLFQLHDRYLDAG
jgi:hypothetical protein